MDRKKIIKVGIFAIVVIVLFIWGYSFLKSKNLFSSDTFYYGLYTDVNGLTVSNSIYMSGMKIGTVREIYFVNDSTSTISVIFSVKRKIKIPENSTAEIRSHDLMGTKAIHIIRPEKSAGFIVPGDTLKTAVEAGLKEQVNQQILPLKAKAEDLISSFDSVLIVVQAVFNDQARQNLAKSFVHIKTTLENLSHASFNLDTILSSQKGRISRILSNVESISLNLKNNNEHIANILQNFSSISDSIAKADFASVITRADSAITSVNKIVTKINTGEGTLGMLIYDDKLYKSVDKAAKDLDALIIDIKKNPKKFVHFSAFDFGRTIIVDDEKAKEKHLKKKKKKDKEEAVEKEIEEKKEEEK